MMKYIFCNSNKECNDVQLNLLCKRENVIYHKGSISDITDYYSDNTAIVLPYIDPNNQFVAQRKKLVEILAENDMDIQEIGTAVWVPIDKKKNYGIAFTSNDNVFWAFISATGLVDKFPFKINTIIIDVNDYNCFRFEDSITRAMATRKKLDDFPNITNIYYNP